MNYRIFVLLCNIQTKEEYRIEDQRIPYGVLEMKNNLIGVMVFKIHIWIMIWNS